MGNTDDKAVDDDAWHVYNYEKKHLGRTKSSNCLEMMAKQIGIEPTKRKYTKRQRVMMHSLDISAPNGIFGAIRNRRKAFVYVSDRGMEVPVLWVTDRDTLMSVYDMIAGEENVDAEKWASMPWLRDENDHGKWITLWGGTKALIVCVDGRVEYVTCPENVFMVTS